MSAWPAARLECWACGSGMGWLAIGAPTAVVRHPPHDGGRCAHRSKNRFMTWDAGVWSSHVQAFTISSALGLAGCKSSQPGMQVQHAIVPAPVRRVDPKQVPREPPPVGSQFNGDAKRHVEVIAPNAQALGEWGREMRTLLERCVGKRPWPHFAAPIGVRMTSFEVEPPGRKATAGSSPRRNDPSTR